MYFNVFPNVQAHICMYACVCIFACTKIAIILSLFQFNFFLFHFIRCQVTPKYKEFMKFQVRIFVDLNTLIIHTILSYVILSYHIIFLVILSFLNLSYLMSSYTIYFRCSFLCTNKSEVPFIPILITFLH